MLLLLSQLQHFVLLLSLPLLILLLPILLLEKEKNQYPLNDYILPWFVLWQVELLEEPATRKFVEVFAWVGLV